MTAGGVEIESIVWDLQGGEAPREVSRAWVGEEVNERWGEGGGALSRRLTNQLRAATLYERSDRCIDGGGAERRLALRRHDRQRFHDANGELLQFGARERPRES